MPKIKYLGTPDLGAVILGTAVQKQIPLEEIALTLECSVKTACNVKKDLLNRLSFNDVMKLCKLVDLPLETVAATLPLRSEELRG